MYKGKFIRYGLLRRIRRGVRLPITIIHKCNLYCGYCALKLVNGVMPFLSYPPMTLEKMKNIIVDFPLKISEVTLTGGEPALNKDFTGIVNWLLNQGICVLVYSNLTKIKPFLDIKRTPKFRIVATYHSCYNRDKFILNYEKIKHYHRVDVDELGKKTISVSRLKAFCSTEETKEKVKFRLRIGIDGLIFQNCYDWINYYTKK